MEAQNEATIDAIWANFQSHVAQTIMSVTANQQRGSLNSAFAADQNIRGVQTFRDPTRSIHRGDDIYAQITAPVTVGDEAVIPPGAFVQGQVDKLEQKGGRGELHLQSLALTFPDGHVALIAGPVTLESADGYALKDPGNGRMISAFVLPAAGAGLGALIGHAASNSQGTTITNTLPPNCGVPTPGYTNGTTQSLTIPGNRLQSTAIGSVAAFVMLMRSHNFFLDVGSPVDMTINRPLVSGSGSDCQRGRSAEHASGAGGRSPARRANHILRSWRHHLSVGEPDGRFLISLKSRDCGCPILRDFFAKGGRRALSSMQKLWPRCGSGLSPRPCAIPTQTRMRLS